MIRSAPHILVALTVIACSPGDDDPTGPTAFVFADPAEGRLVVQGPDDDAPRAVALPGEPTEVVVEADRVLVSLRGVGQVVELSGFDGGFTEQRRIDVGVEPYGLAVSPADADEVYVALGVEHRIARYDLDSGDELWSLELPCEPRFVALAPWGTADDPSLVVTCVVAPQWLEVKPATDAIVQHALPARDWLRDNTCPDSPYAPRVSGRMAFSPDGRTVYFPAYYVANLALSYCDRPFVFRSPEDYFEKITPEKAGKATRMMPVLIAWPIEGGAPSTWNLSTAMPSEGVALRGYPNHVAIDPRRSDVLWVTSETSGAVFVVDLAAPTEEPASAPFLTARRVVVDAPLGAVGVSFGDGEAWIWSWIRGEVTHLPLSEVPLGDAWPEEAAAEPHASLPLSLSERLLHGRNLVYDTRSDLGTVEGSGVVCYTCHVQGRLDGLSWEFGVTDAVNTLILSGKVLASATSMTWSAKPLGLTGEVESVSKFLTDPPILGDDAVALAAYVSSVRDSLPVPPRDDEEAALIEAGREIFERADTACTGCHAGPDFTTWGVVDFNESDPGIRIPPLRNLRVTGPYLHDGRAKTLRQAMDDIALIGLGDTTMLDDGEKEALVAYLESL